MIKLGSKVLDVATGLNGMVTHLHIEMDGETRLYNFKIPGVNNTTGEPLRGKFVVGSRLQGGEMIDEPDDMPFHILGTPVKDEASGIEGIATAICLHISGCVHVSVQRPGLHGKSGEPYPATDCDIRLLTGPAIKPLTSEEVKESHRTRPSPIETESPYPATPSAY